MVADPVVVLLVLWRHGGCIRLLIQLRYGNTGIKGQKAWKGNRSTRNDFNGVRNRRRYVDSLASMTI